MKWKKFLREARSQAVTLFLVILVMAFFRTALADWSYVPSGSMEPTLYHGDYVWINKTQYGPSLPFANIQLTTFNKPKRGDIITFVPPHTDKLFVKRVIGIPGDTIEVLGNTIAVNGKKLPKTITSQSNGLIIGNEAIAERKHQFQLSSTGNLPIIKGKVEIPDHKYFVLGDHRNNSADSRFWGFVDEDKIMGKVTHVAISFSSKRPLLSRIAIPTP